MTWSSPVRTDAFATRPARRADHPVIAEVRAFVRAALLEPVERDQADTPQQWRRRQIVVAITLVVGAVALGAALAVPAGDPLFYLGSVGVAAVWVLGALASGRLHLGRARTRSGGSSRAVVQGLVLGAALLVVFLAGALVVAQVQWLRTPVDDLLDHALHGSLAAVAVITAINGVAEELFFRGAVYAALPRRINLVGSTVVYAASTILSGVPLLTFAALCLGLLTGMQRRVTGGVLGSIVSHLTWSLGMLFLLPLVLRIGV